jgi:hypothetical protein
MWTLPQGLKDGSGGPLFGRSSYWVNEEGRSSLKGRRGAFSRRLEMFIRKISLVGGSAISIPSRAVSEPRDWAVFRATGKISVPVYLAPCIVNIAHWSNQDRRQCIAALILRDRTANGKCWRTRQHSQKNPDLESWQRVRRVALRIWWFWSPSERHRKFQTGFSKFQASCSHEIDRTPGSSAWKSSFFIQPIQRINVANTI